MIRQRLLKIRKERTYDSAKGEYSTIRTSKLIQTGTELSKKYNIIILKVEDNIWDERTWFYVKGNKKDYEEWARELLNIYSDYISGFKI